jgi:hypothetical protein
LLLSDLREMNWERHNRWRRDGRYGQFGFPLLALDNPIPYIAGETAADAAQTGHYFKPIVIGVSVGVGTWLATSALKYLITGRNA